MDELNTMESRLILVVPRVMRVVRADMWLRSTE
jgi:hypothetical protein